jgi:4-diphosphocytidyl-2-C-methyl-D-erythritol kinase
MRQEVRVKAAAKVNLHLEVLGRRPDGFHDLVSLFQTVSLADTIALRVSGLDGTISVKGAFDVPLGENLIARAVELFRSETGLTEGIEAAVEKRIPLGGGFGGGSSDAAAVLRGLQVLFDSRLPVERLRAMAAALGSDVPFFLEAAAALVEGRGERVFAVEPRTDFTIAALIPPVAVSTADAFRWIDEETGRRPSERISRREITRMYSEDAVASWRFSNSFDEPVFGRIPSLRDLRDLLLEQGAAAARLTGSGSTVIGIFADRARAQAAARALGADARHGAARGVRAEVLAPLASEPAVW